MAIAAYQIVIASIIIMAGFLKGQIGANWAAGAAVVWTIFHIVAPWLMLLQFGTILIAYAMGSFIARKDRVA